MSEATSYFSIAVAVIILLVDLWAIISVFRSDKTVGGESGLGYRSHGGER
ncbi:hypothetical protein [Pseudomonas sp. Root329]